MTRSPADKCRVPQAFWRAAERVGLSAAALLRQARLPANLHVSPDTWLTTAQYFALWRAVEALSGDPAIGLLMTTRTENAAHPPATMSAFFARDYRDGLHRLARFKRLCTPEGLAIEESGAECRVSLHWHRTDETEPDAVADVFLASVLELGRRGTGRRICPRRVEMTRRGPPGDGHRAYFDAPIRTGCARNAVILAGADLDLPFAGHNPELLAMLEPALAASMREIEAQSSLPEQVRILIGQRIASGRPDLAEIAGELGLSARTLQRRIGEDGASFRELVDEVRRQIGQQLLANGQNSVDEIAFLLGFQDTSSFYRAFRGWEGVTPAQWRGLH